MDERNEQLAAMREDIQHTHDMMAGIAADLAALRKVTISALLAARGINETMPAIVDTVIAMICDDLAEHGSAYATEDETRWADDLFDAAAAEMAVDLQLITAQGIKRTPG